MFIKPTLYGNNSNSISCFQIATKIVLLDLSVFVDYYKKALNLFDHKTLLAKQCKVLLKPYFVANFIP